MIKIRNYDKNKWIDYKIVMIVVIELTFVFRLLHATPAEQMNYTFSYH